MKPRISKLQIARFLIQVIFLIFLPGLFTLTFSGIKLVYMSLLKGDFNLVRLLPQLIEAISIIPLTIVLGRFFCGWFCAFGAFNEFIYKITSKVFKTKFRIDPKLDSVLKYLKYLILVLIIIFMWTGNNRSLSIFSPWEAFSQVGDLPQALERYLPGFLILLLIAVWAVLGERFFCRYLCPLGAVFSVVSKVRLFRINKPTAGCGKCRICTNNCPAGLKLYKTERVDSGECFNCLKCLHVCPRKNTQATICNAKLDSAVAGAFAVTAFTSLYSVSNLLGNGVSADALIGTSNGSSIISQSTDLSPRNTQLTEQGSPLVSAGNPSAESSVQDSTTQSPATSATTAIPAADPTKAPASAATPKPTTKKSTTAPKPTSAPKATTASTTTAPTTTATAKQKKYNDGTYTGVGRGHRYGLQVSVQIVNDKITDIQILSNNETPRYSMYPFQVIPPEIIQAQSSNVDAVSGATETSEGIMEAVADALSQARA